MFIQDQNIFANTSQLIIVKHVIPKFIMIPMRNPPISFSLLLNKTIQLDAKMTEINPFVNAIKKAFNKITALEFQNIEV